MSLEFELYPIDKKNSDYRFLLIFEPMSIMYDTVSVLKVYFICLFKFTD